MQQLINRENIIIDEKKNNDNYIFDDYSDLILGHYDNIDIEELFKLCKLWTTPDYQNIDNYDIWIMLEEETSVEEKENLLRLYKFWNELEQPDFNINDWLKGSEGDIEEKKEILKMYELWKESEC